MQASLPSGETPDPPPPVTLIFEGRPYRVPAGLSVAGALARLGIWDLSRSQKYHRPQGAACMSGTCAQCAMRIDGLPSRLACQTPVHDGIRVERQNVLLSRRLDPVYLAYKYLGFRMDHHHFMVRPRLLNAIFVRIARRLSGLGRLPDASVPATRLQHRREHMDALVVGAGNAGMASVKELSAAGRQILWVDDQPEPGGRLGGLPEPIRQRHNFSTAKECLAITRLPGVRWLPDSRVLGWFEDEGFVIRTPNEMLSVRAKHTFLCTGTTDLLPAIPGGDLPGVLTPLGAQRLLLQEGYRPDGLVVLAGGDGHSALLEEALTERGDRVLFAEEALAAKGYLRISTAKVRYQGRETWVDLHDGLLVVESGAAPAVDLFQQAGGCVVYDASGGIFAPDARSFTAPDGCLVEISGSAQGARQPPDPAHGHAIVCACEDVTASELSRAIAHGYADMELLKRYTGLATGPCQGKSCLCHGARMLAASAGSEAVRATRFRPPTQPVSLAEVAGAEEQP